MFLRTGRAVPVMLRSLGKMRHLLRLRSITLFIFFDVSSFAGRVLFNPPPSTKHNLPVANIWQSVGRVLAAEIGIMVG